MKTITLTSRNRSETLLTVDDTVWGALPRKAPLSLFGKDEGALEADDRDVEELREAVEHLAWDRLVRYLAVRERSSHECVSYLARYRVHPSIRSRLLSRAQGLGYLSDDRFAGLYAAELLQRGQSKRAAIHALRARGITPESAERAVQAAVKPDEEEALVERAVEKALRRAHGTPRERREKALGTLYRQGFDLDAVMPVVERLMRTEDEETTFSDD